MSNSLLQAYYQSKKTSEVFMLIKKSDGQVVLENSDGKQTKISESTFKRWYAKTDMPTVLEKTGAEKIQEMETEVNVEEELPPTKVDEEGKEYIDFGKGEAEALLPISEVAKPEQSKVAPKKQSRYHLLGVVFNKAKELGATVRVNTSNTPIKVENKNIAEIIGNNIYFSYSALPTELFHNKNVSFAPEAWKWTLSVKVAIKEDTLDLISKLLEAGKAYRLDLLKGKK
jgi:hypothetical protein